MLSGPEIAAQVKAGSIVISNFDHTKVGPNSYDLHLDTTLAVYEKAYALHLWRRNFRWWNPLTWLRSGAEPLNPKTKEKAVELEIPVDGMVLYPGVLYLGSTVERTSSKGFVPWIEGRSSIGRLGLGVHITAGLGDDGVDLQWTLELTCVHPILVFPGMKICQICFVRTDGESKYYDGKYQGSTGVVASRYYLDTVHPKE